MWRSRPKAHDKKVLILAHCGLVSDPIVSCTDMVGRIFAFNLTYVCYSGSADKEQLPFVFGNTFLFLKHFFVRMISLSNIGGLQCLFASINGSENQTNIYINQEAPAQTERDQFPKQYLPRNRSHL